MWGSGPYMDLEMTKNRFENGEKLPFSQSNVKKAHLNGLIVKYLVSFESL